MIHCILFVKKITEKICCMLTLASTRLILQDKNFNTEEEKTMQSIFTLPAYIGIILIANNEVLLVKRHNTDWASGKWNFPGGLLEPKETLLQAAIREAQKEAGLTVQPNDFELVHVLQVWKNATNTKDIIGFYFKAEISKLTTS